MHIFRNDPNQKRIHTTIDYADAKYCKENNLKYAHLLRASIRDHRLHSGDPDVAPSVREIQIARDKAIAHRDKILKIIRENLTEEQYDKFIEKLK